MNCQNTLKTSKSFTSVIFYKYLVNNHFEDDHNEKLDWGCDTKNCSERNQNCTSRKFGFNHSVKSYLNMQIKKNYS